MILRQKSILISVIVVESLIILTGSFYLMTSNPPTVQNRLPMAIVINIDGEVISTKFFGVFERKSPGFVNATPAVDVIRVMEHYSKNDYVKAFILEFDSFGGQTAGWEELARYIKRVDKPVIAVVKGSALSSGYYVAASTDKLYAGKNSRVGEIGKVSVYVTRERKGQRQACNITSSNYMNITINDCQGFAFSVFERLRLYTKGTHELLVSHVSEMRGLPVSHVEPLSSDAVFNGEEALALGLVDELGTTADAMGWLEQELGITLWAVNLRVMQQREQDEIAKS